MAYLPDLSVTGSSEAILQGQKPPFRLMARAVHAADGTRATHIRPAISESFVVSKIRVTGSIHLCAAVRMSEALLLPWHEPTM